MALTICDLPDELLVHTLSFIEPEYRTTVCRQLCRKFRNLARPDLLWVKNDPRTIQVMSEIFFTKFALTLPVVAMHLNTAKITRAKLQDVVETPENRIALRIAKLVASQYLLENYMKLEPRQIAFQLFMQLNAKKERIEKSKKYHSILQWGSVSFQTARITYIRNPGNYAYRTPYMDPSKATDSPDCRVDIRAVLIKDYLELYAESPVHVRMVYAYLAIQKEVRHIFDYESYYTTYPDGIFEGILDGLRAQKSIGGIVGLKLENNQLLELINAIRNRTLEALRIEIGPTVTLETIAQFGSFLKTINADVVDIRFHHHPNRSKKCPEDKSLALTKIWKDATTNAGIKKLVFDFCKSEIPQNSS